MKSDCPKFERTIHSQSSQPTENAQSQVCFGRLSIPNPLVFLTSLRPYLLSLKVISQNKCYAQDL